MPIESATSIRAASDEREAARVARHVFAAERSYTRRDQRVEEAKKSDAARPTVADRAAEVPRRAPTGDASGLFLDVLA